MTNDNIIFSPYYYNKREFYIQVVDTESYLAIEERHIGRFTIKEMADRLGCDVNIFGEKGDLPWEYDLTGKANTLFGVAAGSDNTDIMMVSWSESDGLPYRTHGGREFLLMKEKAKPLSVFTSTIPNYSGAIQMPERLFDGMVEAGHLVKNKYCEAIHDNPVVSGIEVLMYALPSEEWRINAYALLRSVARKMGWSKELTRLEGSLLGYSEWQNDAFLERLSSTAV